MNARRFLAVPFVLVAIMTASGCTELPLGQESRTPLTLTVTVQGQILVGDTTLVIAEARDELGRLVSQPPLVWELDVEGATGSVDVVRATSDTLWIVGADPGSTGFEVGIGRSDRLFTAESASVASTVQYGPIEVRILTGAPDTVLTTLGSFQIPFSVVDHRGRSPQHGFAELRHRAFGPIRQNSGPGVGVWTLLADYQGLDTLILSHTACSAVCEDTVVVRVEQIPVSVDMESQYHIAMSLGQQIFLRGSVRDAAGYPIDPAPLVWRLVDPADSVTVQVTDSIAGIALARAEGEVLIAGRHGVIEGLGYAAVRQEIAVLELSGVAPYLAGVGVRDTARVRALDGMGNPIDITAARGPSWASALPGVAEIIAPADAVAVIETRAVGQTTIHYDIQVCSQPGSCTIDRRSSSMRVLPEPDSVRIVSEYDTTMPNIGPTGAYFFGDVFLPGEVLSRVQILWTALDPGVATIDELGMVTTHSIGTARMLGRMGAAADTVTITVTPG